MTAGFAFPGATAAVLNAPAAIGTALSAPTPGANLSNAPEYGLTMWFSVRVENPDGTKADLGLWSACSGLGVKLDVQEVWSAYNLNAPYLVPHRISYEQITLQRAMELHGSGRVRLWLKKVADEWINHAEGGAGLVEPVAPGAASGYVGTRVTIALYCALDRGRARDARPTGAGRGGGATEVATWELANAVPVSWSGPSLASKGGDVAIETLKLAHRGWLGDTSAPGKWKAAKPHGVFGLANEADPTDKVEFQYSPEKVKLENAVNTRGESQQSTTSDFTSANVYNKWNVTINQLHVEGATKVKAVREKLRSWMDAEIASTKEGSEGTAVAAPRLKISFGSAATSDIPTVCLKSVSIELVRFTSDGTPNRAIVTISVVAAKQDKPPAAPAATAPAARPRAHPRAGAHRDLRKGAP